MSIFRRDSEQAEPTAPVAPARTAEQSPTLESPARDSTHIAAGSKVVGEISGSTELVIDGEVEGEIVLDSRVVIGSKGLVKGQIQARSVQVGGKVRGNVRGLERVEVQTSGRLEGDVISPRVVIAEGAFFKGKVEMTDKVEGKKPVPKSRAERSDSPAAEERPRTGKDQAERGSADKNHSKQGGRNGK